MEMIVIAKCPECQKVNIVSLIDNRAGIMFYDDCDDETMFMSVQCRPAASPVVALCDNCGKDFVVDVELEAHVSTRKIKPAGGES